MACIGNPFDDGANELFTAKRIRLSSLRNTITGLSCRTTHPGHVRRVHARGVPLSNTSVPTGNYRADSLRRVSTPALRAATRLHRSRDRVIPKWRGIAAIVLGVLLFAVPSR